MIQHNLLNQKIEKGIRAYIQEQGLTPGDRLPTVREFSRHFNTSVMPVQQAMRQLTEQGMVERFHGKGTFLKRAARQTKSLNRICILYCHGPGSSVFTNPFGGTVISGMDIQARAHNQSLLFQTLLTGEEKAVEDPGRIIRDLIGDVDGLILFSMVSVLLQRVLPTIRDLSKPVVMVNNEAAPENLDAVLFDAAGNVRQVVDFLIGQGHRRIGCLCYNGLYEKITPTIHRRVVLFKEIMAEQGLEADPELVHEQFDVNDRETFRKMMERPDKPSAVFCTTDHLAYQIMNYAREEGIRVPDDLTVVGYDGLNVAGQIPVPLTTLETPLVQMGKEAVRRFIEKREELANGIGRIKRILIPGQMRLGASHKNSFFNNPN